MSMRLLLRALMLSALLCAGLAPLVAQEGGMPPEMMGGGGDPNQPPPEPVKPEKPILPAPLEPDMSWLDVREKLLTLSSTDRLAAIQFGSANSAYMPTDNPLVQQLREYMSDKYIVSQWQQERPLGNDWTYPVPVARRSREEISASLQATLKQEAETKFKVKTEDEYRQEAERKYTMCKPGQTVRFRLSTGRKSEVSGRLVEVSQNRILLLPRRFVSRDDLNEETAAFFFKPVHDKVVEKYVKDAVLRNEIERTNYISTEERRRLPQLLLQEHYVQNHIDFREQVNTKIFKLEHWISRIELVRKQQEVLWRRNLEDTFGTRMRREFMTRMGFQHIDAATSSKLGMALRADEENRYLGWVPRRDVDMMKAWLVKRAQYDQDMATYQERLKQYEQDKKRYDDWKKAHPEAGDDEDDDE